jgi:hypothetical protein
MRSDRTVSSEFIEKSFMIPAKDKDGKPLLDKDGKPKLKFGGKIHSHVLVIEDSLMTVEVSFYVHQGQNRGRVWIKRGPGASEKQPAGGSPAEAIAYLSGQFSLSKRDAIGLFTGAKSPVELGL